MLRAYLDGAIFGTSAGDGPPRVLLLHGWRRTHEDFDGVADALATLGIATVSVDLPGFGATPPPHAATGARGYAEALSPLVASLAAESQPPVLVGHSFGGRVATCLAAAHPDLVGALVLTGVPLVRAAMPSARRSTRYRAIRAAARLGLVRGDRLEAARRRYGSADYRAATGVVRDVLVACVQESYEDELRAVRCPVHLVWGELDTTVPLGVARAAASLVHGSTLEVLPGVGHLVPTEAPALLATVIASARKGAP